MHIYVVNRTAAMLLLWNDNGLGADMRLETDLFGVTWLTWKCWLRVESTLNPMWPEQQRTPVTCTNIPVSKQCGETGGKLWSGAGVVEDPTPTLCMCFRGLLLVVSGMHGQLGYNSLPPGWGLQPGFIHGDQTVKAPWCEPKRSNRDMQEIHFKSIILIWTKMLT